MIKSRLNSIKGSCLYQISLPEGLAGKTYGALYQHLATLGMVPLGLFRGTFANMNMGPKANRMPYVFTNPSKETELYSCDRVFVLATTPQRVAGKVEMKDWLLDIQMQQIRQQKEKGNGEASAIVGVRPASHQMKGLENLEKAHKKLDERVSKMSSDMNKKLSSIVGMLERLSANAVYNNGNQYFASIAESSHSPVTIRSGGGEFLAENSRSRFNSIDSMGSQDLVGMQDSLIQQSDSIVTDTAFVEQCYQHDHVSIPMTKSSKSTGSKGGMSFLKRVIALGDNPESQPLLAVVESTPHPNQEISVPVQEIQAPETKEHIHPSSLLTMEGASVLAPRSFEDCPSNAEIAPLPQSQIFNSAPPHLSNAAETYEIDVDDGVSAGESPHKTVGDSPASAAASVVGPDDEELMTAALKHTVKPQASPRVIAVSKKIVLAKTDIAKNNFMDVPAVIPGPRIAALNSQNTDRAAKIRALRIQNGSNGVGSPARPLSASANDYSIYSSPFGQDPARNRSSTFDNNRGVSGFEKRERASSAHH